MKTLVCVFALIGLLIPAIGEEPPPVKLERLSAQWKEAIGLSKLSVSEITALEQLIEGYKAVWAKGLQQNQQPGALAAGNAARAAAFARLASPGRHWIASISGKAPSQQVHLEDGTSWNVAPFGSENITMLKNGSAVYLANSDSPTYPYRLQNDPSAPSLAYCYLTQPAK